jgi:hypothetical protein
VVYRPDDVMFVEVLVVDLFNKTPAGFSNNDYYSFYISFELKDPQGSSVYTS